MSRSISPREKSVSLNAADSWMRRSGCAARNARSRGISQRLAKLGAQWTRSTSTPSDERALCAALAISASAPATSLR
jgi:hypothetical protein